MGDKERAIWLFVMYTVSLEGAVHEGYTAVVPDAKGRLTGPYGGFLRVMFLAFGFMEPVWCLSLIDISCRPFVSFLIDHEHTYFGRCGCRLGMSGPAVGREGKA